MLDNGVTSNERWHIVDCAEDLSWCVFHYAGAAAAVGQQYLGGLLCTPDGKLPPAAELDGPIKAAFKSVNIAMWELFVCSNSDIPGGDVGDGSGSPPLAFFRRLKK